MQLVSDAVKGTDITLYGGTLCSNQGQRTAYYNELIQPIIIPFVPEKGKTVICDFENDELGTAYGMTGEVWLWWKTIRMGRVAKHCM